MKNTINVILFDLGGVLVDVDAGPFPKHWFDNQEAYSLKQWARSSIGTDFECGRITALEFAEAIKKDLGFTVSTTEILHQFTQWPTGLYDGVPELLTALNQQYTVAVLSNTNELHWPRITDEFQLSKYSNHLYASHLLKVAKPSKEAFDIVLNNLQVAPQSVVFLDDNEANIEAAKAQGLNAHLVKGIDEVRETLMQLKLLP